SKQWLDECTATRSAAPALVKITHTRPPSGERKHTMQPRHYKFWPKNLPTHLTYPQTSLYYNLHTSATRYPDKRFVIYYDSPLTFRAAKAQVDALAGYLQRQCGVARGDRVLLFMQNSPQFILAFYAILRADAMVVPVNPMNLTEELSHYVG